MRNLTSDDGAPRLNFEKGSALAADNNTRKKWIDEKPVVAQVGNNNIAIEGRIKVGHSHIWLQ